MSATVVLAVLLAAGVAYALVRWNSGVAETILRWFGYLRKYVFTTMWLVLALVFIMYGGTAAVLGFFIIFIAFLHAFTNYDVWDAVRERIPFL